MNCFWVPVSCSGVPVSYSWVLVNRSRVLVLRNAIAGNNLDCKTRYLIGNTPTRSKDVLPGNAGIDDLAKCLSGKAFRI